MLEIILAWTMSCTQYDEAIKNLYQDEYFARPENLHHRSFLQLSFLSQELSRSALQSTEETKMSR